MVIPKVAQSPLSRRCPKQSGRKGFTLVELLVVITVIAVLASLLMPALSKAKAKANTAICLNNKRQLNVAWIAYSSDHEDHLVMNSSGSNPGYEVGISWATGRMAWHPEVKDNTNVLYLTHDDYASLARYLGRSSKVFKCPADRFLMKEMRAQGWLERVRSISMNYSLGAGSELEDHRRKPSYPDKPIYIKMTEIPKPSELISFLDEHPDSINEKTFSISKPFADYGLGYPANYHGAGAVLGFVDGHSRRKQWADAYRILPVQFELREISISRIAGAPVADSADYRWLSKHLGENASDQLP